MQQLLKNMKATRAITITAGAAGTSDINGATLDMSGFEGVLIAVQMGAITSGAVTSIKVQQDSASGMGTAADLLGSAMTVADDDDEELFLIDVFKPEERYLRVVVDRGTANAVVAGATYYQYGPIRKGPIASHGTGVNVESHVSPIEGTA